MCGCALKIQGLSADHEVLCARYVETVNLLGPPPPPQRLASQVRFLEVEVGIDVDDLPEIIAAYPKVWNYEDVVVETTHLQRMLSKYSVCGLAWNLDSTNLLVYPSLYILWLSLLRIRYKYAVWTSHDLTTCRSLNWTISKNNNKKILLSHERISSLGIYMLLVFVLLCLSPWFFLPKPEKNHRPRGVLAKRDPSAGLLQTHLDDVETSTGARRPRKVRFFVETLNIGRRYCWYDCYMIWIWYDIQHNMMLYIRWLM